MVSKKSQSRTFERMSYRQIQRKNSRNRNQLTKDKQQWLKDHGYYNLGWNNVINLFQKIKEIQELDIIKKSNLEELFIEADRIGNKYLNNKEINQFNLKIAQELNEIADIIDLQFPDHTFEVIDYSK